MGSSRYRLSHDKLIALDEEPEEDPVPQTTSLAWRKHQSYYALLEIIDAHLDPNYHEATKADVKTFLGEGIDDGLYPNSGPDMWVYTSTRHVPHGTYLLISFDKHGVVKEIDWADE